MTWIIEEQENISRKDMLKLARRAAGEVFYINTPSSGLWSTKEKLSEICKNLS